MAGGKIGPNQVDETKKFDFFGVDLQGERATDVGTPTVATDATNKSYVDTLVGATINGFDFKAAVTSGCRMEESLTDAHVGIVQFDVLADNGNAGVGLAALNSGWSISGLGRDRHLTTRP